MPQNPPAAVTLAYRAFTRDELAALPEGTLLAQVWQPDGEPDLFRKAPQRYSDWAVLTGTPQDYDFERWTTADLHSEHALYAVIYQPA